MTGLNSFNIIDVLYRAYNIILMYISNFLQTLGSNNQEAVELSPIVLLFLAISVTYLTSHMFTAFKKYVQDFIVLFAVIILIAVIAISLSA
jgi:glucan phosphoethanolaminetransferase (alkaline phosphatase superfamily)